jgi:hypothetical protein
VHLVGTVGRCLLCDIIYCSAVQAGSFHTFTSGLPNLLLVLPNLLLVLPSLLLVLLIYFWFYLFTSGST